MELIASVSRSSGLEKDGDALRDPKIQEEYRAFIQGKVDEYWKKYPLRSHRERADAEEDAGAADADARRNRKEMEDNLLIVFRKLREGVLSTQRRDAFALEVYETSLHLSVLFNSPVQTTSTLSHLFPDLYINVSPSTATTPSTSSTSASASPLSHHPAPPTGTRAPTVSSQTPDARPGTQKFAPATPPPPETPPAPVPGRKPGAVAPRSALASTLIFLLHLLAQSYPSQIAFHTQLRQLHPALQDVLRAPASPTPTPLPLPEPLPPLSPRASALPSPLPSASASASETKSENENESVSKSPHPLAASSPRSDTSATASRPSPGPGLGLGPRSHSQEREPPAAQASASASASASAWEWVLDLARCLRARNYARLEALTRREAYAGFVTVPLLQQQFDHLQRHGGSGDAVETSSSVPEHGHEHEHYGDKEPEAADTTNAGRMKTPLDGDLSLRVDAPALALEALGTLVEALLDKARGTTWAVLRSAYREVSLLAVPVAPANSSGTTAEWLVRSLVLRATGGNAGDDDVDVNVNVNVNDVVEMAERWLDGRRARGEARRKEGEGMEGRWVLVKA
ncbi:hypothetical protein L226DRAFT_532370 [Lentinus tigrinus ALCF2SS1-7]|nr:hypothetical protein L226DRAFT_532370 [Lentinus tigrinus ALCF2SS1-7]